MADPIHARLAPVVTVANSICAAISNQAHLRDLNPILLALKSDPLTVLANYGLPSSVLEAVDEDTKADMVTYLKGEATSDLEHVAHAGPVRRGFFRCWACRVGLAIAVALAGVAISVATVGVGGAIFTWAANWLVMWGLGVATAQGLMVAASVAGSVALTGGIGGLIEFICSEIPETC